MFWFYLCLGTVILAALLLTAGVCIWVYQDAKERGERAWLWVLIILISSPLLGGLVYLIARREERRPCRFCGWMLERDSHYCSHCGKQFPFCEPGSGYKEDLMLEHPKHCRTFPFYLFSIQLIRKIIIIRITALLVIPGYCLCNTFLCLFFSGQLLILFRFFLLLFQFLLRYLNVHGDRFFSVNGYHKFLLI